MGRSHVSEEFAPATVVKVGQIMGKIMLAAVADGRIVASPCVAVDLPTIELIDMRFLSPEEVAALADAMNKRYRAIVFLGAYGGLRVGERFALRGHGYDSLRCRVQVTETVVDVSGHLYFGPPKTRAGRRAVPLPRAAADELDRHVLEHDPRDGLVFTGPKGGPVRLTNWRRQFWNPAVEKAGLGSVRPHDLRHTAVSLWIAAGGTPKEIATRAGHRSVATVLDRYGHLFPGSEDFNDALDELASRAVVTSSAKIISIRRSAKG